MVCVNNSSERDYKNTERQSWVSCVLSDLDLQCSPLIQQFLTLLLPNTKCPVLANSVDPDQKPTDLDLHCLSLKYVNFYQKTGSSNLIGLKLEVGLAS